MNARVIQIQSYMAATAYNTQHAEEPETHYGQQKNNSYLNLVIDFWKVDLEYSFSPIEVAIYFRLLDRCNSLVWKNPFGFKCDELRSKVRSTNAESKTAFDTARNRLKQAGLIDFSKGNGRGHVTQYTIKGLRKGNTKVLQFQPLSNTLSDTLSGEKQGYINRSRVDESISTGEKKKNDFVKPTIQEVAEVMREKGCANVNREAENFWHHHETRDWQLKTGKMKNWKSAVVTWLNSPYRQEKPAQPAQQQKSITQRLKDQNEREYR